MMMTMMVMVVIMKSVRNCFRLWWHCRVTSVMVVVLVIVDDDDDDDDNDNDRDADDDDSDDKKCENPKVSYRLRWQGRLGIGGVDDN